MMLKRLRWRFIASAMGAIFVVLVIIIGSINLAAFVQNQAQLDATLMHLIERKGLLPEERTKDDNDEPAEIRYFYVRYNQAGHMVSLNTSHLSSAAIANSESYAHEVYSQGKSQGYINNYRYMVRELPDGKLIYFLDSQHVNELTKGFALYSFLIALLGYIGTFILVVLFSKHAIRPFTENYHRQRRFITDAGHELKTPLAVISADADIIELTQGKSEWTDSIHHQVRRMSDLVGELLKLAKMEENGPIADKRPVEFHLLLQETVNSFRPMATGKRIQLISKISDNLIVLGDGKSLTNLVSVLMDNAIKYSLEDSDITIEAAPRSRGGVFLRITNQCENPPDDEELNRLFERFYRPDNSRSRDSGGFGIGLSMAKAIVQAHNGRITAQNLGDSVRFTVQI